ncbi:MAG: methyltransferase family protein [Acidobacteriaceae bacterium]
MVKLARAVLFFLSTLSIYLVIPLVGWGLGHLAKFFSYPPRLGYAIVVALFSLAVSIQAYESVVGIRGGKGEKEKFVFRQHVVRILLIIAMYVTLFFIPLFDRLDIGVFPGPPCVNWLGVVFSAIGYFLIFLSGLALGRQYSQDVTIQPGHRLITWGVYRFIRHPRYLGIILLAIGVSLVFRSWIGLIATIVFSAILLFRIQDEETTMHQEFGVEWEVYRQRSWRLLPYVY